MIHVAGQPTYFLKTKEIARVVMEHFVGVSSSDRGALDQEGHEGVVRDMGGQGERGIKENA